VKHRPALGEEGDHRMVGRAGALGEHQGMAGREPVANHRGQL